MKTRSIYISLFLLMSVCGNAQSLEEYLNIAKKNSPELKAANFAYESILEKTNEVTSLPNTMIGFGYFFQEVETRVGAQKAKVSISQQLPWFGTLAAKKESVLFKAEAQLNVIEQLKRKLFLDIEKSYYQLYVLTAKELVLKENIQLLKVYEKLALTELENSKASLVDVLKIQIEFNSVSTQLSNVQNEMKTKKRTFNLLLNRGEESIVVIPSSVLVEENSKLFSKKELLNNPKLKQLDNLKLSLKHTDLATKKEGMPKIGLGFDYVFVEKIPGSTVSGNGKDIIMPMLSVSLPIFSKKHTSKRKQIEFEQKVLTSKKVTITNQLYSLYATASTNMQNARESIKTLHKNIKQVDVAQKVVLTAYETGKMDFEQIIELQQLKLKFELERIALTKEWAIQKSNLNFLTQS